MSSVVVARLAERDLQANSFPRTHRLRKSAEFKTVFQNGKKVITGTLIFHVHANELGYSRLGLAVSRKVGKAVKRNKVKRRIREAFRHKSGTFPEGYDIVVIPRKGVLDKLYDDYLGAFEILLRKLKRERKHQGQAS